MTHPQSPEMPETIYVLPTDKVFVDTNEYLKPMHIEFSRISAAELRALRQAVVDMATDLGCFAYTGHGSAGVPLGKHADTIKQCQEALK